MTNLWKTKCQWCQGQLVFDASDVLLWLIPGTIDCYSFPCHHCEQQNRRPASEGLLNRLFDQGAYPIFDPPEIHSSPPLTAEDLENLQYCLDNCPDQELNDLVNSMAADDLGEYGLEVGCPSCCEDYWLATGFIWLQQSDLGLLCPNCRVTVTLPCRNYLEASQGTADLLRIGVLPERPSDAVLRFFNYLYDEGTGVREIDDDGEDVLADESALPELNKPEDLQRYHRSFITDAGLGPADLN